jgi:hypothetical protein
MKYQFAKQPIKKPKCLAGSNNMKITFSVKTEHDYNTYPDFLGKWSRTPQENSIDLSLDDTPIMDSDYEKIVRDWLSKCGYSKHESAMLARSWSYGKIKFDTSTTPTKPVFAERRVSPKIMYQGHYPLKYYVPFQDCSEGFETSGHRWVMWLEYHIQDSQRLLEYHKGMWWFETITVTTYVDGDKISHEEIKGIDSNSDEAHKKEIIDTLIESQKESIRKNIDAKIFDHKRKITRLKQLYSGVNDAEYEVTKWF